MEKKLVYFTITLLLISLMAVSVVSAGWFDFLKPTGRLTSQLTNVSVGVSGINPVTVTVDGIGAQNPTENGITYVPATVHVSDPDGVNDVDDSSVNIAFTRSGEATRSDSACDWVSDESSTSAVFLCNVSMQYYDLNTADWSAVAKAKDKGNLTEISSSPVAFTYNLLQAMTIAPSAISWGILSTGAVNQSATNDPTTVTNTGNFNGTIKVTGLNLLGATTPADMITADKFKVDPADLCGGTALVNASSTEITGTSANRGLGGTEELYYCIPSVPSVPSQTYSTAAGGSWTVGY